VTRDALDRSTIVVLALFGLLVAIAILAPWLVPHDPYAGDLANRLKPPAWLPGGDAANLLGTDVLGRDLLSRLLIGARVSLLVAILSVLGATLLGSGIGVAAGYAGGWIDTLLMRVVDLAISLPMILLALLVGVLVGPSLTNIVIIIGLVLWAQFARMARNETLRVKNLAYVDLARAAGCSSTRIVREHVLPNIAGPLIVLGTLQVGTVIVMEASLSFLGVGVPPPAPAWGSMIAEGRSYVFSAWWICIFPGLAILSTVLVANFLGDRLAQVLTPERHRE
jgi:peptide/nickel transport system permease protein